LQNPAPQIVRKRSWHQNLSQSIATSSLAALCFAGYNYSGTALELCRP